MKHKLFMAVDLGTSFLKTGVYSLDGTCLANWSEPVHSERPEPGVFIQHGDMLYAAILSCIRNTVKLLEDPADVCAIAFTGQMAGSMGVDEHWNDVTGWSCSLDSRYLPYANRLRERHAQDLFEVGGTNAPVMGPKYAWFKDAFPGEHRRIAKYVMLNGYMIGRLANIPVSEAMIDYSLITWTGMADIKRLAWSPVLCGDVGMEPELLPNIVPCTAIGGYLDAEVARGLNLKAGIPLVIGAGDKVSGCTGAGILREGGMIFEASSYGAISCKVRDARMDLQRKNYDIIGAVDDGGYYLHKYIQGSGIAIDWFVNEFIRLETESQRDAFARIEAQAAKVPPGSEQMLSIGLLNGSAIPFDSETKGLFIGHTLSHTKAHFYRALLEGFTYDLALTLDSMRRQYPEYRGQTIKLIGGGAKSPLWPQILADVCGYPFQTIGRGDAALWGTALLAAAGTGEIADLGAAAEQCVRPGITYTPDPQAYAKYQPYVRLYEQFVGDMRRQYEQLNRL